MDPEQIEAVLAAIEAALAAGGPVDPGALGYWKAVAAVKREPRLVPRFATRIGAIDRALFERRVRLRCPLAVGLGLLSLGALVGLGLVLIGFRSIGRRKDLALLLGSGLLIVSTHDLAHVAVGWALGVRFVGVFLGGKGLIEPGLKIDYTSYLQTSPRRRAWMHAAGAIVTKLVSVLAVAAAVRARASALTIRLLAVAAGAGFLTDLFFSTRYSDWRRFRREMRIARALTRPWSV
ncbi:MAG: hypothetical protein IRY83_04395 [Chloroflexi bacterium]|nr:hypothetical protein [Chloroflexota bacterium]